MRQPLAMFALLAVTALSSACGTTAANTIDVAAEGEPVVKILNSAFASDIEIKNAKSAYLSEIMEVVVTLENVDNEEHYVEYLSKWFDKDDYVMNDTDQPWISDFIAAGELKQIKVLAPKAGAKRCRFLVRFGPTE